MQSLKKLEFVQLPDAPALFNTVQWVLIPHCNICSMIQTICLGSDQVAAKFAKSITNSRLQMLRAFPIKDEPANAAI